MAKKSVTDSFMRSLVKATGNELASIMSDDALSNTTEWISTGSRMLDGVISADVLKGIPNNKVIAFAGEESVGKTYLMLAIAKEAIKMGYIIAYFDSENATEKEMVVKREIDPSKLIYVPVDTAEEFKNQATAMVNKYNENEDPTKPKMMIILDSLGNLSTNKEIADADKGENKVDMSRNKVIKSIFRVLNLKLAKAKIPMLISGHVYVDTSSFIPKKVLSGGGGLKYAASVILYLTKKAKKDKDGNILGVELTARVAKSRYSREGSKAIMFLDYLRGLHLNYGLQEFGGEYLKKETKGWSLDGKPITEKELWKMTWDDTLLNHINDNVKKAFAFGDGNVNDEIEIDEVEDEE